MSRNFLAICRRYAWAYLLVIELGVLLYGVVAVLFPSGVIGPGFLISTGLSWQQYADANSSASAYFLKIVQLLGGFNSAFGVLGSYVVVRAFRQKQRWAWYALLIGNLLAYGGSIAFDLSIRAFTVFEVTELVFGASLLAIFAVTYRDTARIAKES